METNVYANLDSNSTDANLQNPRTRNKKNTLQEYEQKLRKIKYKKPLNNSCKYCNVELIKGVNIINKGVICYNCLFNKWYNNTTGTADTIKCNTCKKFKDKEDFKLFKHYKNCTHCRNNTNKKNKEDSEDNEDDLNQKQQNKDTYIKIPVTLMDILLNKVLDKELTNIQDIRNYIKV